MNGVTVVVVSYNVAHLLEPCLASVYRALDHAAVSPQVVVVDNASSDQSPALVRDRFPRAMLVENTTNAGFGMACNQGLAIAGDAVLFLNPDTELALEAISVLLDRLRQTPDVALTGPQLRYPDGRPQPTRRRFPDLLMLALESSPAQWRFPSLAPLRRYECEGLPEFAGPADWLSGACLLGRTAALREVGGFDPAFFMYFEEVDLSRRLAARGWRTWYEPAAIVVHHHSQSADQDLAARDRYYYTSKFRYTARYFGATAARVVFAASALSFAAESLLQRTRDDRRLAARHAALARLHLSPPR